jgi:hypothetical protein
MIYEPEIDVPVEMPWDRICQIAVAALCSGRTMNDIVMEALGDYLLWEGDGK